MKKKLTIGMPVYNDRSFLGSALTSLLQQTYKEFQLIISDDCSSDGSAEICQKYAEQDSRIRYIRQDKNIGISRNMEFLIANADSDYFMWAADDDLWDKEYIEKLIAELDKNPAAVTAFGSFQKIDENGNLISEILNFDYSGNTPRERLIKLIRHPNDSFGYGIFRRAAILEVRFPVWWWPNEKTAYNNIYPSLCYYLCQGEYANVNSHALFYNRFKKSKNINHRTPYPENSFNDFLAYATRRFNLVTFSTTLIRKSKGKIFALKIYPILFYRWFVRPVHLALRHYFKYKFGRKINSAKK